MDYSGLRNESDVRGIALEGIEGQHVNLTPEATEAIGRAFVVWLRKRLGKDTLRISIGRDSRLSGPALLDGLKVSMANAGAEVTDLGMTSTPAMFMTTVTDGFRFDGAVMVTASHLPFNRNGFKFFTGDGGVEATDIRDILAIASSEETTGLPAGKLYTGSFMDVYSGILTEKIRRATGMDRPLTGLKVVVDAGNGAGGFFVEGVLKPLGADTEGSRFLEPDGSFPNHIPNPEDQKAMESITEAVLQNHADLGIIFDTDVDRAGAVLPDGSELNRNALIAMMSAILLRDHPGTAIVTDSVTSTGLKAFIEARGGVHHRFKRGYRNVINESVRLNGEGIDSQLAMETSGHGALKENYFLDDGAYLMTKLLIELANLKKEGRELRELVADLKEPMEAKEFRMNIVGDDFHAYGETVLEKLTAEAEAHEGWVIAPDNREGIRVTSGDGWFLLRMSLHEPLMPMNIEGESEGSVKRIARELLPFFKGCDRLETGKLEEFCK